MTPSHPVRRIDYNGDVPFVVEKLDWVYQLQFARTLGLLELLNISWN